MRNLDDLIHDLGGVGLSQVLIVGLSTLPRVSMGWCMLSMSFASFVPSWCCPPANMNMTSDEFCQLPDSSNKSRFSKTCWANSSTCENRWFTSGVQTVVNEWDLVCDRKWKVPLTTSLQMTGVLVGALMAGQMTDMLGRKKTVYLFTALCAAFNIAASFSNVWEMFAMFSFLIGVTIGGYISSGIPYATEFIIPSKRAVVTMLPTFNAGTCLLALVAWRVQDWRQVYWLCGAMTTPFLLGYFFLPESLRWLTVQGRHEEAQKVVEWLARWNRTQVPKDSQDVLKAVAEQVSHSQKSTQYTYLHIYKGWRLFKTSFLLQLLWSISAMCVYGISFGASTFGSNMYLNILLLALIGLPNFLVVALLVDRLGRRRTAVIFYLLSSCCSFATLIMKLTISGSEGHFNVSLVLNILNKSLLGCGWSCVIVTTNEIYPTVIRGLGYGASNVVARVGAILAPFLLNFTDYPNMAQAVIGGSLLVAAGAVLLLEETSGVAMQDAIVSGPTRSKHTANQVATVSKPDDTVGVSMHDVLPPESTNCSTKPDVSVSQSDHVTNSVMHDVRSPPNGNTDAAKQPILTSDPINTKVDLNCFVTSVINTETSCVRPVSRDRGPGQDGQKQRKDVHGSDSNKDLFPEADARLSEPIATQLKIYSSQAETTEESLDKKTDTVVNSDLEYCNRYHHVTHL